MIIIGVDYHPEFQQIAFLDGETGEFQEKRLSHPKAQMRVMRQSGVLLQRLLVQQFQNPTFQQ